MGILSKMKKKVEHQKTHEAIVLKPNVVEVKRYTKSEVEVMKPDVKVMPKGYSALGDRDKDKLLALRDYIINEAKIFSYDYESNSDIKNELQDPQDTKIVSMSFAYQRGQAFYIPMLHKGHDNNVDKEWLRDNFLKPILEHPDVVLIAHNFQAEHKWNLLDFGIDIFPKAENKKVIDTMMLLKAVAPNECMYMTAKGMELAVGLKQAAKNLLADKNGMIHGIKKVDDIKEFEEMVTIKEVVGYTKAGGHPRHKKKVITFDQRPVDQETIDYGCFDSDAALGLYHLLMPTAEKYGLLDILYDMDFLRPLVLAEYELTGWHVSKERLEKLRKRAERELHGYEDENGNFVQGIEEKLHEVLIETVKDHARIDGERRVWIPAGRYPMGMHRDEHVYLVFKNEAEFNWSSRCLQWLFFHVLQIPFKGMKRSKKTGLPSTDKDNLEKILLWYEDHAPLIRVLKEKKKYEKIISTYVEGMGQFVREDSGRIHTQLRVVNTWRLASSKPNLQNIPRADNDPLGIRGVFVAPTYDISKDYSHLHPHARPNPVIFEEKLSGETMLIGCDYSQIELKVLAWFAMEKRMIETLANGGDLHSVAAKDVFKLDCDVSEVKSKFKKYRYRAKKVNFGIVYGMTEYGLSDDPKMNMTVEQAQDFIEDYMKTYPGIRRYAQSQIKFAQKHGYVETMFGHRRNIPEINSPNKWQRKSAENKAMNTPIQGSAADIIAYAMNNFRKRIPIEAPYLKPVMQIHDELLFECPVEYVAQGARFVKEVMETPIPGFSDIMPIVAEPAVGKIWAHNLDIDWDENGVPFVQPKVFEDLKDKEPNDVTLEEIEYALPLYEMAGIEVRQKWVPKKKEEGKSA